jgi:hypothetical protein
MGNHSKLYKIISGLDHCRQTKNAKDGFVFTKNLCKDLGVDTTENVGGGLIIRTVDFTIHVFQPFPDIDRVYYEY